MLQEVLESLEVCPGGTYLDGSFGGGGHARGILSRLGARGQIYAIDRDPMAIQRADLRDERLVLEQCRWSELSEFAARHELFNHLNGVLLDLGLSSPQVDEASRGFSFMRDGPLDMRMDPQCGEPASEWLNRAGREQLKTVFQRYGEEPRAARIAAAIVKERLSSPIQSTVQLAELIARHTPKPWRRHPATRVFQAIRIHVNRELDELEAALACLPKLLIRAGRLVVISFHSLEDRMVKRFLRRNSSASAWDAPGLPLRHEQLERPCLRILGALRRPGKDEIAGNPRARSARMRVAERI